MNVFRIKVSRIKVNKKNQIRQMFFVFDDGTPNTFTPIINDIKKPLLML